MNKRNLLLICWKTLFDSLLLDNLKKKGMINEKKKMKKCYNNW